MPYQAGKPGSGHGSDDNGQRWIALLCTEVFDTGPEGPELEGEPKGIQQVLT